EKGLGKRATTFELDPEVRAGHDVELEVHPVAGRVRDRQARGDARLVVAFLAQPLLDSSYAVPHEGLPVWVTLEQLEHLAEAIGRQSGVTLHAHLLEARSLAGVQDDGEVLLAAVRYRMRLDLHARGQESVAVVAGEKIARRLGQPRRRRLAADGEVGHGGGLRQV